MRLEGSLTVLLALAIASVLAAATACRDTDGDSAGPRPPKDPVVPESRPAAAAQDAAGTAAPAEAAGAATTPPTAPGPVDAASWSPGGFAGRTTSGGIALTNLDARIDGLESAVAKAPSDEGLRETLVETLLLRSQTAGRYDDLDRAAALAEAAAAASPGATPALLLRAKVLGAVHRFAEARRDLEQAAKAGADVRDRLAVLDLAIGRDLDSALAFREAAAKEEPGFRTWSSLAAVEAALGRFDEADRHYREALAALRDVSPFPVAWTEFQRGVMWAESAGRPDRARPLYEEAVRRLPGYAVANVHLAELEAEAGELDRAVARLEPFAAADRVAVGDPEPAAVLAELLSERDPERSRLLAGFAKRRYETLLAKHEAAFADHAAEFFMGPGADPARALELARRNLEVRRTDRAFELGIEAARAAGDAGQACAWAKEAGEGRKSVPLGRLLGEVRKGCGGR